jgi:pyruvate,water dikinase
MAFRALARRMHAEGHVTDPMHVFMLMDDELEAYVANPSSFRDTLAARYETWLEISRREPPFFIKDGILPPIGEWPVRGRDTGAVKPAASGETIQGVPGCPGTVTGRARVILDPAEPGDLAPGDIMVAPLTDPAWTPLFMAAGGVVVDVGGQISHAIIVSRELGLPCVVSATDATRRIPDGALIEVDGSTGTVTILEVTP